MCDGHWSRATVLLCLAVGGNFGLAEPGVFAADQAPSASAIVGGEGAATVDEPPGPGGGRRGDRPVRKACHDDVKKLCAGVKPGEGRIAQCLKQHAQELSPGCTEQLQGRAKFK